MIIVGAACAGAAIGLMKCAEWGRRLAMRVHWEKRDALRSSYCFTVDCDPPVGKVENVSLFHGNLVEAYHGEPVTTTFLESSRFLTTANEFHYERLESEVAFCKLPQPTLAMVKELGQLDSTQARTGRNLRACSCLRSSVC